MMPTMPPAGSRKLTFSKMHAIAVRFAEVDRFDDHVAQPRAGRDLDFQLVRPVLELLGGHRFVGLDAGLALGLPGRGAMRTHSSSRAKRALPGGGLLLFDFEPLLLLFQPRRVVAFERMALAAVELQNPLGDVVEEVAVVRHGDDRAGILVQMPLQPGDALGVEVVGRFVEQQQVGPLEQNLAQRDAAPLAAGERFHVGVARRQVHRAHGDFDLPVELPGVHGFDLVLHLGLAFEQLFHLVGVGDFAQFFGELLELGEQCPRGCDRFLDVAEHVLVRVELRLLLQQADGEAVGEPGLAVEVLVLAGHDPQQRAFAGAVAAQHADLGTGIERQPDIFEDFALANLLGQRGHLEDVFLGHAVTVCRQGKLACFSSGDMQFSNFSDCSLP